MRWTGLAKAFLKIKELISFQQFMGMDDPFSDGEFVTSGPVFELFRDVNPVMNRVDLWKVTSAWWFLEGRYKNIG